MTLNKKLNGRKLSKIKKVKNKIKQHEKNKYKLS